VLKQTRSTVLKALRVRVSLSLTTTVLKALRGQARLRSWSGRGTGGGCDRGHGHSQGCTVADSVQCRRTGPPRASAAVCRDPVADGTPPSALAATPSSIEMARLRPRPCRQSRPRRRNRRRRSCRSRNRPSGRKPDAWSPSTAYSQSGVGAGMLHWQFHRNVTHSMPQWEASSAVEHSTSIPATRGGSWTPAVVKSIECNRFAVESAGLVKRAPSPCGRLIGVSRSAQLTSVAAWCMVLISDGSGTAAAASAAASAEDAAARIAIARATNPSIEVPVPPALHRGSSTLRYRTRANFQAILPLHIASLHTVRGSMVLHHLRL
jgi:hypothetical protein